MNINSCINDQTQSATILCNEPNMFNTSLSEYQLLALGKLLTANDAVGRLVDVVCRDTSKSASELSYCCTRLK
ncbi:hypothetical protein [Psychromonas marina]|uniref:hypothetical protein n=1 Tax=Psychromonas marina TaxID=88364 RepID=UPI0024E146CF|nr:hypothetical protein [Psychromonas marina]